jgi:tetratricopeptide (TPR) repeat protein
MTTNLAAGTTRRPSVLVSLLALAAIAMIGWAAVLVLRSRPPGPSLESIRALARERQFRRAQGLLATYLQDHRDDAAAHLLMAQLATEPPEPSPELALDHLRAVRPQEAPGRALVRFFEGKARYQQRLYDLAEAAWSDALRLDPTVPEAGWALIDLLDKEGRVSEAHALGMRLIEVEPDPIDRARLLLEMARMDIEQVSPGSQVLLFGPLAREHPDNLPMALTLGLALVRDSRGAEGIEVLEDALRRHPDSPAAWDAWLTGLEGAFRPDRLAEEFARLPRAIAADPRFAEHEGMVAQDARDWPRAVRAFRRAAAYEPSNGILWYRLRAALRRIGATQELDRVNRWYTSFEDAFKRMRPTYHEALAVPDLGVAPHPELCHRLADLRERMGRPDEAGLWHQMVLRHDPSDAISLAALERLKSPARARP